MANGVVGGQQLGALAHAGYAEVARLRAANRIALLEAPGFLEQAHDAPPEKFDGLAFQFQLPAQVARQDPDALEGRLAVQHAVALEEGGDLELIDLDRLYEGS